MAKKKWWKGRDVHHIVGQSCRQRANVEEKINKMVVERTKHEAYNTLVWNCQSPQWFLESMRDRISPVMTDSALELLDTLINMDKRSFYKPELLKWKKRV